MSGIQSTSSVKAASAIAVATHTAHWFAVYTSHRHEKHVAALLHERDIETLLPLYRVGRQWKKSAPIVLELPLFPCYLFTKIPQGARGTVLGTPGVLAIVGSRNESWPLRSCEIDALRLGNKLDNIEPHPYLRVGERVRIKNGPMSGLEGILARKKNTLRFVLTIDVIMRSVAVEVDAADIETADRHDDSQTDRVGFAELCQST